MTGPDPGAMRPDRRQLLLETAAREFAGAGYEGASLNRIIRRVGMSKSSFYHFIGSKEALFDLVVTEAAAALGRELAIPPPEHFAGPDFWAKIEDLGQQLAARSAERTWYVDFGQLFYLPDPPAAASAALGPVVDRISRWLDGVLAAGRQSGAIRTDLPASLQTELAFAVLRALDQWSLTHLATIAPADMPDLARLQVDVLRRLLTP